MRLYSLDPRRPGGILMLSVLGGLIAMPVAVLAQATQHRMMVFEDDSGGGPQIVHFTGPDFGQLRRPDFVRKDLPIFHDELQLDAVQTTIVGVLLDAYLDAFRTLVAEAMPQDVFAPPGFDLDLAGGPDGDAGAESLGAIIRESIANAEGVTDIDIEADGTGPNVAIAIMARAGDGGDFDEPGFDYGLGGRSVAVWAESGEGGDGDGDGPVSSVLIAVGGPDGVELPDEVREKLEQAAQAMAERLLQRLQDAEAEGVELVQEMPGPEAIEQRRQHIDQMRAAMKRFARQKAELTEDFLVQVRAQLSAEQLGNWPSFDRAVTRIKTLPEGRLDGERTDLLVVADDLDLTEQQREDVAELLEAYEIELDDALRARNEYLQSVSSKLDEAIEKRDFKKALSLVDAGTRRRVAVRGANEKHTDELAAKLGEETGGTFRREVLRRSYPRVYHRTVGQKSFERARELADLDDDTRSGIAAIEDAYSLELAACNERLREAIHRYQPQETRHAIEGIEAMMSGDGGSMDIGHEHDDPIHKAFRKRRNLDERFMKQLHVMLTPEQIERIPKLPSESESGPFLIRRSGDE